MCLDTNDPNTMWEDIKTEITRARESIIKEIDLVSEKNQPGITEGIQLTIEQLKLAKCCDNSENFMLLNRSVQQCCDKRQRSLP